MFQVQGSKLIDGQNSDRVHFPKEDMYVIPAKVGIHRFLVWIPDISLQENPD